MDLDLTGKRALVTGSTSGIGTEIAYTLAAEGASVVVHGRNRERVERVTATIHAAGGQARGCIADLTNEASTGALVDAAIEAYGGIDILVNNAGIYDFRSSWTNTSPAAWLKLYDLTVIAAVRLISSLLPHMLSKRWGRIVNISSSAVTMPPAELPEYASAKGALAILTLSLARYCAGRGVTANTVTPGLVRTPGVEAYILTESRVRNWEGTADSLADRALHELLGNPPAGWGAPTDVAYVVAMLASPRASWVNGADLRIDGAEAAVS